MSHKVRLKDARVDIKDMISQENMINRRTQITCFANFNFPEDFWKLLSNVCQLVQDMCGCWFLSLDLSVKRLVGFDHRKSVRNISFSTCHHFVYS